MTRSAEPPLTGSAAARPSGADAPGFVKEGAEGLPERWRGECQRLQELQLPRGRVALSCAAELGSGGLGRHLQEIVDALARRGQACQCICGSTLQSIPRHRRRASLSALVLAAAPLGRVSPGWRIWTARAGFDAEAACRLGQADHLIAFNRQALEQMGTARRAGYETVSLMSGSPHVRRVQRQHARAYRDYPLERSFGTHVLRRYLVEYEMSDRIYVASSYTWASFVEEGVPEEKLALFPLTPDPRYRPASAPAAATFDVVYIGSLTVAKGVPLLVDAFRRLRHSDMRLLLVGGWKSRGMRRFLERACHEDPRIVVSPGDPLPALRSARLCVHPTYEDGFAYAPAEALACGVPALVSEDTGMRELIEPGVNGLVIPTGDLDTLSESIDAAHRREILDGR